MELKRYVLLENKEIIKTNEKQYICTIDNCLYTKVDDWIDSKVSGYTAIKSSDNILDLVEVGDLVEDKYNNILKVESVFIDSDGDKEYYCIFDTWQEDEITVIYKRQANGDYKRYEVTA